MNELNPITHYFEYIMILAIILVAVLIWLGIMKIYYNQVEKIKDKKKYKKSIFDYELNNKVINETFGDMPNFNK